MLFTCQYHSKNCEAKISNQTSFPNSKNKHTRKEHKNSIRNYWAVLSASTSLSLSFFSYSLVFSPLPRFCSFLLLPRPLRLARVARSLSTTSCWWRQLFLPLCRASVASISSQKRSNFLERNFPFKCCMVFLCQREKLFWDVAFSSSDLLWSFVWKTSKLSNHALFFVWVKLAFAY